MLIFRKDKTYLINPNNMITIPPEIQDYSGYVQGKTPLRVAWDTVRKRIVIQEIEEKENE